MRSLGVLLLLGLAGCTSPTVVGSTSRGRPWEKARVGEWCTFVVSSSRTAKLHLVTWRQDDRTRHARSDSLRSTVTLELEPGGVVAEERDTSAGLAHGGSGVDLADICLDLLEPTCPAFVGSAAVGHWQHDPVQVIEQRTCVIDGRLVHCEKQRVAWSYRTEALVNGGRELVETRRGHASAWVAPELPALGILTLDVAIVSSTGTTDRHRLDLVRFGRGTDVFWRTSQIDLP